MEEEWLGFLRDNAPDLYKQAVASRNNDIGWRNRRIEELEAQLQKVRDLLPVTFAKVNQLFTANPELCGSMWVLASSNTKYPGLDDALEEKP